MRIGGQSEFIPMYMWVITQETTDAAERRCVAVPTGWSVLDGVRGMDGNVHTGQ